jgi:hypothetical protein
MKSLRLGILLLVSLTNLCAAPPRFYVTGQNGRFKADAGTVEDAGYYPYPFSINRGTPFGQDSIQSGTKTFRDFAVGAEFSRWFSLEVGYAHFNAFSSPWMSYLPPYVETAMAVPAYRLVYRLQAYRITPVVRFPITRYFNLKLLGGFNHSDSRIVTGQLEFLSLPLTNRYTEVSTTHYAKDSYHLGGEIDCNVSKCAVIEARFVRYAFGKIPGIPYYYPAAGPPGGNRMSVTTYSLGLSWRL